MGKAVWARKDGGGRRAGERRGWAQAGGSRQRCRVSKRRHRSEQARARPAAGEQRRGRRFANEGEVRNSTRESPDCHVSFCQGTKQPLPRTRPARVDFAEQRRHGHSWRRPCRCRRSHGSHGSLDARHVDSSDTACSRVDACLIACFHLDNRASRQAEHVNRASTRHATGRGADGRAERVRTGRGGCQDGRSTSSRDCRRRALYAAFDDCSADCWVARDRREARENSD